MASLSVQKTADLPPRETLEERFLRLAAVWHRETAYFSDAGLGKVGPMFTMS